MVHGDTIHTLVVRLLRDLIFQNLNYTRAWPDEVPTNCHMNQSHNPIFKLKRCILFIDDGGHRYINIYIYISNCIDCIYTIAVVFLYIKQCLLSCLVYVTIYITIFI